MLVLALDLATVTGWAMGRVGEIPRYGAVRVRQPGDPLWSAPWNLETFLQDATAFERPDLVVYEAPIGNIGMTYGDGRRRTSESLILPIKLEQAVERYCLAREIRFELAKVDDIRKHFIGARTAGDRERTKRAVFERCKLLGYLPKDRVLRSKSDPILDVADSIAVWDYACNVYGGRNSRLLHLYGEEAR